MSKEIRWDVKIWKDDRIKINKIGGKHVSTSGSF